jgi:hypothetical protein
MPASKASAAVIALPRAMARTAPLVEELEPNAGAAATTLKKL